MVLLDATVHLDYELAYRCRYAHRRLARLGSPRSWSPHGADRAALSSASQVSKPVDAPVLSTRLVPTMMGIVEVAALATSLARQRTVVYFRFENRRQRFAAQRALCGSV
jgi:hypothetical protein